MSGFLSTPTDKSSIHRTAGSRRHIDAYNVSGGEKRKHKKIQQLPESSSKTTKSVHPNPHLIMSSSTPVPNSSTSRRNTQGLLQQEEEEQDELLTLITPSRHGKHHRHEEDSDEEIQHRVRYTRNDKSSDEVPTGNPTASHGVRNHGADIPPRHPSSRVTSTGDEQQVLICVRSSSTSTLYAEYLTQYENRFHSTSILKKFSKQSIVYSWMAMK